MRSVRCGILANLALAISASAQQVSLPRADAADSMAVTRAMRGLARDVLAKYPSGERDAYLNTAFRLQMVAGEYVKFVGYWMFY